MAAITPTNLQLARTTIGAGAYTPLTATTLGTGNVFDYRQGTGQILIVRNPTGSSVSMRIDGADGVSAPVDGFGVMDTSAGYGPFSIGNGQVKAVPLDTVSAFAQGLIAATGAAAGLIAYLINPIP